MDRTYRVIRAGVIVLILAVSLGLLPFVGLPYQPLEATAARLTTVLYDRPVRIWLPLLLKDRSNP